MINIYKNSLMGLIGVNAINEAWAHARREFPKESCGFVSDGVYTPCENIHSRPNENFEFAETEFWTLHEQGKIEAVIHSHPNAPIFPSRTDMASQIEIGVSYVILQLNEDQNGEIVAWGGSMPVAPVIGRPFVHGVFDCYSLIRDVYRLGKTELKNQEIDWPLDPIELPEIARDDEWWLSGADLYRDHLKPVGFREISFSEVQPGDGFLIAVGDSQGNPHKRLNHAGVLVGNDLLLHHLPNRLSRREPAGIWARAADIWVRYEGNNS